MVKLQASAVAWRSELYTERLVGAMRLCRKVRKDVGVMKESKVLRLR